MSNWNGKAGKGAMRTLRESKREEAQERQASFRADVARIMRDQNVTEAQAKPVAAAERRLNRAVGRDLSASTGI